MKKKTIKALTQRRRRSMSSGALSWQFELSLPPFLA
jgi:hypothetical protein